MSRIGSQIAPLYRRLPHGPNGMAREEVARNQRTRIYGGMIESVHQRGYHGTAVAHVIALAGVSRRAFYEQFPNKQECFLATYDIVVARARKRLLDAWVGQRGWDNRVHAACKALLDEIADEPKGPRLVLVDALGVGPKGRERMELANFAFERLVGGAFRVAPDGVSFPRLTARGIVGGVRHAAFVRVRDGRERELYTMADEVLDWIESYRSQAVGRIGMCGAARTPRVPPASADFLTLDDRRARMLGAIVHLTLDEGYNELTDPQIAQFAGLSTEAFHKQFATKEECYLAVLDEMVAEALETVQASFEKAASWPEGVYRAITAFVHYLVGHQALMRIAFIDIFEVGPAMLGRITRSIEAFTALLTEQGPPPRRGPEIAQEAVTGALWSVISAYAANDRIARLPSLVDHLAFIVLAPYVGPKEAVEAIEASRRPLRPV
jgi:AcrR family transcriptional regulator